VSSDAQVGQGDSRSSRLGADLTLAWSMWHGPSVAQQQVMALVLGRTSYDTSLQDAIWETISRPKY